MSIPNMTVSNIPTPPADDSRGGQAAVALERMRQIVQQANQIDQQLAALSSDYRNNYSVWETAPPQTAQPGSTSTGTVPYSGTNNQPEPGTTP